MKAVICLFIGLVLGAGAASFSLRVPYWPAHTTVDVSFQGGTPVQATCYIGDQISLAAVIFEKFGLLSRAQP